jgi:hypothetical protein
MQKKLYLLGPITNWPDHAKEFSAAQLKLEEAGYKVINPLHVNMEDYFPLRPGETLGAKHQLRADLVEMLTCDGVAMLPVHVPSDGCARELHLAHDLDMPVDTIETWIGRM